jgi:hypothetical protein
MNTEKSPAPPGALVQLDLPLIDEGKLVAQIERKLRHGLRELLEYETETGDRKAKAKITVSISLCRMKGAESFFDLQYSTKSSLPTAVKGTAVIEKNGRLLCQPGGSNEDPEQQLFFDRNGRIIGGGVDKETGEEHPVAGTIGKRAQG